MTARRHRGGGARSPEGQSGFAILVLLVLLTMGALYAIVRGLNDASAQRLPESYDQAVLRQARDALIAYAAMRPTRPGAMPCPDLDDDGIMGGAHPTNGAWDVPQAFGTACNVPQNRIGRLPWQTLGLPDLRDSTGERLWFALSNNFRNITANPINSDTVGQLTVGGDAPASNVIAIIFAPGAPLCGQDRTGVNRNIPANYLERENGDAANDVYVSTIPSLTADCAAALDARPINDKLLVIRSEDLFPAVENVVARRFETEIRPVLYGRTDSSGNLDSSTAFEDMGHFQRWTSFAGAANQAYYPFAAPFVQPDTSSFAGQLDTLNGLPPVMNPTASSVVRWSTSSASVVAVSGGVSVWNVDCSSESTDATLVCKFNHTQNTWATVSLTATLLNVTSAFIDPVRTSDVSVNNGSAFASITAASNQLVLSGSRRGGDAVTATVSLAPRWSSDNWFSRTRVAIQRPGFLGRCMTQATPPAPTTEMVAQRLHDSCSSSRSNPVQWFFQNNWHRVTFYAVSPSYVLGGATPCNPSVSPRCIKVTGFRGAGSNDNKHLALILAGRPLSSQGARPAATIASYLEGINEDWNPGTSTFVFDFENAVRTPSSNDKVAVMAP